jgi:hypothetical protein
MGFNFFLYVEQIFKELCFHLCELSFFVKY